MDINELMIPVKSTRLREGDAPAPNGGQAQKFNSQAFSSAYKSLLSAEKTARQVVQRANKADPNLKLQVPPASMDPSTKRKILLGIAIVGALMVGQKIKMMNLKKAADLAAKEDATPESVMGAVTGQPAQPLEGNNSAAPAGDGTADANAEANATPEGTVTDATATGDGQAQDASAQGSDQAASGEAQASGATENEQGGYKGTVANSNEAVANAKVGDTIQRDDGTVVTLNQGDIDYAQNQVNGGGNAQDTGSTDTAGGAATADSGSTADTTVSQPDATQTETADQSGGIADVAKQTQQAVGNEAPTEAPATQGAEAPAEQSQPENPQQPAEETDPWKKKAAEMRANGVTSYNGMSPDVVEKMSDPAFRQKMSDELAKQAQTQSNPVINNKMDDFDDEEAAPANTNASPAYTDSQINSFARDSKKSVNQAYQANRGAINDSYKDAKKQADAARDEQIAQNNATLKGKDRILANKQANLNYANAKNDAQKSRNAARTANRDARKRTKNAINAVASEMKNNNDTNNPVMNNVATNNAQSAPSA